MDPLLYFGGPRRHANAIGCQTEVYSPLVAVWKPESIIGGRIVEKELKNRVGVVGRGRWKSLFNFRWTRNN
jgi:hypothetical protein